MQGKITKLPTNQKSGEIESDDGERFQFGFSDIDPSYEGALKLTDAVDFDLYVDRNAGLIKASNVQIRNIPTPPFSDRENDGQTPAENLVQRSAGKEWIKGKIVSMPTENNKGKIENENGDIAFFSNGDFFSSEKHMAEKTMKSMIKGMGFGAGTDVEYKNIGGNLQRLLIRKLSQKEEKSNNFDWLTGKVERAPSDGRDGSILADDGQQYLFSAEVPKNDQIQRIPSHLRNEMKKALSFKVGDKVRFQKSSLNENSQHAQNVERDFESPQDLYRRQNKNRSNLSNTQPASLKQAEIFLLIGIYFSFFYNFFFPSQIPSFLTGDPQFDNFMTAFPFVYFIFMTGMVFAATRLYISIVRWFWVVVNIVVLIFSTPFMIMSVVVGPPVWVSVVQTISGIIGTILLFQKDSSEAYSKYN